MFFYDGFWYTYIVQLGVMSVNRLISIIFPMSFKHIFSKSRTLAIIGCDFLAGFLIALPVLFSCCRMPYYFEYLAVIYENPLTWHRYLDLTVSIVPCPVMLFAYSFIFMKIRRNNKSMAAIKLNVSVRRDSEGQARNKVNTTELRLLIQVSSYAKM
ncbi:hypothetical protein WR25_02809 isoform A [Diploscapter pachys]|uniref:G-protein coupled receptors family 1 profile domain-containing protein n=1 Tax=Diploscapter pachys TaxID=2018661 RepID=A0A2A2LXY7_9BILA|nr:hypothetical protein WR25_02809 isoform A [Diploscapter pachys]